MKMQPIPFGKYLLLDRINVGGMAEVFKAKAFGVEGFERLVAVKRILPSIAEDEDFVTMFVDEAKIAVQLTHANIAQIFDLGKADDSYYIALEYVHGKDLRTIFERARRQSSPLPMLMACHIMSEVCEGLDYAHNKRGAAGEPLNLVHRDVSPQNILISYDGEVKLIDFGIAKAAGKAGVTQAGMLKGKFGYMSPEQVNGVPLDRRSDIFTAGIVLWELLAGERLFVAETDFATLDKVRTADIMPPSTYNDAIAESLDKIVLKALAKEMDDRYQTAMALHDDLLAFLYGQEQRFSRSDLSSYMRDVFSAELAKELRADEALRQFSGSTIIDPSAPASFSFQDGTDGRTLEDRAIAVGVERPPTGPQTLGDSAARAAVRASRVPQARQPGEFTPPTPPPRTAPFARPPTGEGIAVSWDEEDVSTEIFDKPGEMKKIPSVVPPPSAPSTASSSLSRSSVPPRSSMPRSSTPPPLPSSSVPPPFPSGPGSSSGLSSTEISSAGAVRPPRTAPLRAEPSTSNSSSARESNPSVASHAGAVAAASTKMDVPRASSGDNPETLITGGERQAIANLPTHIGDDSVPEAPSSLPTQIGDESSLPDAASMPLRSEPPVVSVSSPPPLSVPSTESLGHDDEEQSGNKKLVLIAAAALGGVLLIGLLALLIFGGASPAQLTITTEPEKVQLFVDGKPVAGQSPFVIADLEPGAHNIEARANGFEQFNDATELAEGEQADLTVALEPIVRLGGFTFNTSPSGAKVYLDDEFIGLTPVSKSDLEPGVYALRAEHEGNFVPYEHTVPIREGQQRSLPMVSLQPDKVVVTFSSEPAGAGVTLIQGEVRKSLGATPTRAEIRMSAGNWSVEIKKRGYEVWMQPLTSIGGKDEFEVEAVLEREGGDSEDDSRSRLASAARQRVAAREERREERSEERSEVRRASNRDSSRSTETSDRKSTSSAKPGGEGVLAVNSIPWSQVYVDGRLIGNTPRPKVPLKSGRHTLTLVRNDLDIKKKITVNIKNGETTKKIVKLLE